MPTRIIAANAHSVGPRSYRNRQWWLLLATTAAAVAAVDLMSKAWAVEKGPCCGFIDPATNDEAALGVFGAADWVLVLLSVTGLVWLCWFAERHRLRYRAWGLGLVVGGGAANTVDRSWNSAVTDFVVTGPILLNLADVAIAAGLVVFTIDSLRRRNRALPNPLMCATCSRGEEVSRDEKAPVESRPG